MSSLARESTTYRQVSVSGRPMEEFLVGVEIGVVSVPGWGFF